MVTLKVKARPVLVIPCSIEDVVTDGSPINVPEEALKQLVGQSLMLKAFLSPEGESILDDAYDAPTLNCTPLGGLPQNNIDFLKKWMPKELKLNLDNEKLETFIEQF